MPRWQLVGVALLLLGYAVLSHVLMAHAPDQAWTVAAVIGAPLLAVAAVALRRGHLPTLAACLAAAAGLALVVAQGSAGSVNLLYVLQHAVIHLSLAFAFGITLRRGAVPLITALADRVEGPLNQPLVAYTRRLTGVWVAYFLGMVAVSLTLYVAAPWWWWSLYANLLTPGAATALFVGEHLLRYRLHPEFNRVTISQAMRAYWTQPRQPAR